MSKVAITTLALDVIGCMYGLAVGYTIGYQRGADYGIATNRLIMEQDAVNHGVAEYYIKDKEVRFRWK